MGKKMRLVFYNVLHDPLAFICSSYERPEVRCDVAPRKWSKPCSSQTVITCSIRDRCGPKKKPPYVSGAKIFLNFPYCPFTLSNDWQFISHSMTNPKSMQPTIVHNEDLYHPLPPRDSLPTHRPIPFLKPARAAQPSHSLLVTVHHPALHQRPERLPHAKRRLHGGGASTGRGLEHAMSHGEWDPEE